MAFFWTADTHFGHSNVIRYSKRPFSCAEEMDEVLIERWNEIIRDRDTVFHLGDFSLLKKEKSQRILERLRGKIILIKGNHDKNKNIPQGFEKVVDGLLDWNAQVRGDKQPITMCHYAMRIWNKSHYGSWQLHGHSHGMLKPIPGVKQLDVGVDTHDFSPWSLEEIRVAMEEIEAAGIANDTELDHKRYK